MSQFRIAYQFSCQNARCFLKPQTSRESVTSSRSLWKLFNPENIVHHDSFEVLTVISKSHLASLSILVTNIRTSRIRGT